MVMILQKNEPVHVIMVLTGYVDIADSSVNAHLCSLSRAFIACLKKIQPQPLVQKIFHLQDNDLDNEVKVTKI